MTSSSSLTSIRLEPYASAHKEAVVHVFNQLTAEFAYVAEMTEELFEHRIVNKVYFDSQGLIIGYRGERPLGLFHATFAPPKAGESGLDFTRGNIRVLLFPPDDIALGNALLDRGMAYLRERGAGEILGWSSFAGYPFYKGIYMGTEPVLSAAMPHVVVRLVQKGFVLNQHSIFLGRPLEAGFPFLSANVAMQLEYEPLRFSSDWQREAWAGLQPQCINAVRDGGRAGQIMWSLLPDLQSKRGCLVGSIGSLYVDERFKRQGIAKALVAAALREMYEAGAREAIVATTQDNTAALHTYYAVGFVEKELLLGYVCK